MNLIKYLKIMENKYYTPEYSDIYIGQELYTIDEYKIDLSTVDSLTWFLQCQNCYIDCEENTTYGISLENYKLKYLDSSDIEELGFTVVKTKGNSFEAVKKFTFTYDNYPSEGEYNIIVSGDKYCVIKLKDIGETTLFRGEIKNKNVLKQVLKMLDIK